MTIGVLALLGGIALAFSESYEELIGPLVVLGLIFIVAGGFLDSIIKEPIEKFPVPKKKVDHDKSSFSLGCGRKDL